MGNIIDVESTCIYRRLDYKNQGTYIITEVFTHGTVQFQRGDMNKQINLIWLVPHFESAYTVILRTQNAHIWGVNAVSDTTPLQASPYFFYFLKDLDQRPE